MEIDLGCPNSKQDLFLRDRHKHVGYGGARGGGKSHAIRTKAVLLAYSHPGIHQMIVRRTYPELTANHITPLCVLLRCNHMDKAQRLAKYNDSKKTITFPNGSVIQFRYCDTEADVRRFQGTETDILYIDEATQMPEEWIKELDACVRGVNDFPKRTYLTCNPGGVGHAYIKRVFIDRRYQPGEDPEDYSFIKAVVQDNKILLQKDPDYIKRLEALPPKLKKAWLDGEWGAFEGQFFEEFSDDPEHYQDRQYTHVIEPFKPPLSWNIYRSYDFGYGKPFSFGWWAVDHDGVAYRILELYGWNGNPNEGIKWTPEQQFKAIYDLEQQHEYLKGRKIIGVADPSIWDTSRGISIAETGERFGIYFEKGDNARLSGWMQVHYRLKFDQNGYPMMYIFKNCEAFIRTIPLLQYDKTNVEDLDTDMEDHVADDTRYFCMMRPITPEISGPADDTRDDPLDLLRDAKKK